MLDKEKLKYLKENGYFKVSSSFIYDYFKNRNIPERIVNNSQVIKNCRYAKKCPDGYLFYSEGFLEENIANKIRDGN